MTRRWRGMLGLVLVLVTALVADPAGAGNLYNSFGAQSPKIIQSDDTVASEWDEAAGAKKVTQATKTACERLQDQASKGHCVVVDAANLAVISKTTAVTIGGGVANDTYLKRIIVLAALTGTCVFTGFADSDGAAQSFTIPAAFVGERNFGGAKNSAGALTVTCSNASDDNLVLVEWWSAS